VLGEYHAYIGWLGLALVVVGLAVATVEQTWLVALAMMLFLMMLGHFASWAPWTLLHEHVFPFKSMRVPSRFRLLLLVPLSLFVALAIDGVPTYVRRLLGKPRLAH